MWCGVGVTGCGVARHGVGVAMGGLHHLVWVWPWEAPAIAAAHTGHSWVASVFCPLAIWGGASPFQPRYSQSCMGIWDLVWKVGHH